jgi:PAS domain S-box-containing protein
MRVRLAGAAVVVLVVSIFLARPDSVAKVDDWACDLLTGSISRGKLSNQVAIVEIDETSLAQFGRWPWPRDLLGLVVRRILDRGAATVVLDTMLQEEDRGVNDDVLAGALNGNPVVVGYAFRFDGAGANPSTCVFQPLPLAVVGPNGSWGPGFFHASGALCNATQISKAAAGAGFLNAAPDSDGKLRRVPLVMEYGDGQYPSLALAAYNVYRHASPMQLSLNAREASQLRLGTEVVRLEGESSMRLRFRGGRRTFPYVPVSSVLNDRVPMDTLRGKIAIVGGSALGLPNPVATPLDAQFPDVEVQATAIDNLLQGDSFHRAASFHLWEVILALLAGLATTLLLARVRSWWGALIVLGIGAGAWAGCALLLSRTGLLLSPLPVTVALVAVFPVVILLNYLLEKRRAEHTERQLVSEREHAREVQRESESRYQRLVENINDAIIVDDAEGRLLFANRRFREWFGLEGRDIGEVVLEDCVAPEWRASLRDQRVRRMSGETVPDQYEYAGVRPDGTRIWIESLVTNVVEDGRIVGTQSALRDITGRKQMEAQYLQAQKMESIGRLASGVAHDFNNLLTVINGYGDMLLSERPDEDEYRSGLKEIRAAGERAAELTRNLLAFSRKQLAQPKALDLNAVVADAEKMFRQLIGEDVELITRLSPALGLVMADSGQLHQILMNLLVNARDAMPRGGTVVIETKNVRADEGFVRRHPGFDAGSYVYLGVTDTGTGMSEEVQRRLFEPFFTTKEPGKGTGLGLATIYRIVQQSAGRIEVTSELGQGSTFHIYLPRVTGVQSAPSGARAPVAIVRGSGTVLVVEDQDAVRQYLRVVLESAGYRVLQAANGPEALAVAEQFSGAIDLLVTDLVLPLMNGRELAERLKRVRPEVKVLFTSGYAEETMGSRGIIASDLAYLPKPFDPEKLKAKVREALANPEEPRSEPMGGGA